MRTDIGAIAELLLEGFGRDSGGLIRPQVGRRLFERIHALPGRLSGMMVAVDASGTTIGVAGLRTREIYPRFDGAEERVLFEELGIASSILLDLRSTVREPPPYRPHSTEAMIYSLTVTKTWRGRGVGDALLHALHRRAQELGKTAVLLEVVETNMPARRLYARHGYELVRRRRGLLAWLPFGAPALLLMCKHL